MRHIEHHHNRPHHHGEYAGFNHHGHHGEQHHNRPHHHDGEYAGFNHHGHHSEHHNVLHHHHGEHPGFNHHGEHVFGTDSLSEINGGWLSDPYPNQPPVAHADATTSVTNEHLGFPSTSHDVGAGGPTEPEPSALLTVIGGDAYAAGTNTDATGVVSNTIKDMGNVTVASGYAIFEATGTSSTPGGAAAGADTFLSVTGADIVIAFDFDVSFKIGNTVIAASEMAYMAIDIENWTPPNGPLVMDFQAHSAHQIERYDVHLPSYVPPSGNLAAVVAVADAQGSNTLTSTLTQALTIENHFSLVSGTAMVAA